MMRREKHASLISVVPGGSGFMTNTMQDKKTL